MADTGISWNSDDSCSHIGELDYVWFCPFLQACVYSRFWRIEDDLDAKDGLRVDLRVNDLFL